MDLNPGVTVCCSVESNSKSSSILTMKLCLNNGSVFYLTTVFCEFTLLFHEVFGRLDTLSTLIW